MLYAQRCLVCITDQILTGKSVTTDLSLSRFAFVLHLQKWSWYRGRDIPCYLLRKGKNAGELSQELPCINLEFSSTWLNFLKRCMMCDGFTLGVWWEMHAERTMYLWTAVAGRRNQASCWICQVSGWPRLANCIYRQRAAATMISTALVWCSFVPTLSKAQCMMLNNITRLYKILGGFIMSQHVLEVQQNYRCS